VEDSDSWSETDDEVIKEEEFFTERVPAPSFFYSSNCVEKTKKKTKKGSLQGIAVDQLSNKAFRGHRVKILGSTRNTPAFKCSGYCLFTDCPVEVDVVVHSEKTLKTQVLFSGDMVVHSKTELQRRPVRADEQKEIHQQLKTTLPRAKNGKPSRICGRVWLSR